jgi:hypothetical protein
LIDSLFDNHCAVETDFGDRRNDIVVADYVVEVGENTVVVPCHGKSFQEIHAIGKI